MRLLPLLVAACAAPTLPAPRALPDFGMCVRACPIGPVGAAFVAELALRVDVRLADCCTVQS